MRHDPLVTIAEDIEYLQREWVRRLPDDELRRGTSILRRLVVEQILSHAWRKVGFERQPSILAVDLMATMPYESADVTFAIAGGVKLPGVEMESAYFAERRPDERPPSWRSGFTPPSGSGSRPWPLSSYLESPSLIVNGETVRRREVIKYFANVLGGVHLDLSPKTQHREEELVRRMMKIEERAKFLEQYPLSLELLAIGQSVANSPDVVKLVERIRDGSHNQERRSAIWPSEAAGPPPPSRHAAGRRAESVRHDARSADAGDS